MPPQLAALNQSFLNVSELVVRAALDEDREHVYHAAMVDPNAAATLTLDEIRALCDELIEAHGDLMPAWLGD
jgi:alpha-galactosidase